MIFWYHLSSKSFIFITDSWMLFFCQFFPIRGMNENNSLSLSFSSHSVFFIILSVILSPESVANVIKLRGVWFVNKLGCWKSFNFCTSRLFLSCVESRCQYQTSYLLFLSSWLNKLERFSLAYSSKQTRFKTLTLVPNRIQVQSK